MTIHIKASRGLLRKLFLVFIVVLIPIGFSILARPAQAKNCGGVTACVCGDTVTSNYTLVSDLNCTTDGLVIGANNITINGGGHTIMGVSRENFRGIVSSVSRSNVTISNVTVTNFNRGISFMGTGSFIQNVNSVSNQYGIYLDNTSTTTLTNNTMSTNNYNLFVNSSFNNTIGTTNLVEGKPVYYLVGASGLTFNGTNMGMFWCINCTNVTVENLTLAANNFYGVYFNGTTGSTINNVTASFNQYGIYLDSSSSNNVTNNIISSNRNGIYFMSSDTNTITGNTVNSNGNGLGITIDSSASNIVTSNTANSNGNGLYLTSSFSNVLTNNTMSGNPRGNLYVDSDFDNTIDTTNLVEGKPVYYFFGASNLTFNGVNAGMFWCINCTNVTISNVTLAINNPYGVYFSNTTGSTIDHVIANSNASYGLFIESSSSNTITNNTANLNGQNGIYLTSSSTNTLSGNSFAGNIGGGNLAVDGAFDDTIDTTNLVEGKPVYYLNGVSNQTFDGVNAGMFWCINCTNVSVKNTTLSANNTYGIYFDTTTGSTIDNVNASSNILANIYLTSSSSNTITNSTSDNNLLGIWLASSDSNIVTNNTMDGDQYGLYFDTSNSNTVTGNSIISKQYGIYMTNSSLNILSSNTMSGASTGNLFVTGAFDDTIDTTNLVEGKPVYYLNGVSGQTFDGVNAGMFWCINCTNVTFRNSTLSANNYYGVFLSNTTGSTIDHITSGPSQYGIFLESSSGNSITNNTTNSNQYGIYIYSSASSIVTGNTANSNSQLGFYTDLSGGSSFTGNQANFNTTGMLIASSSITLTGNTINSNTYGFDLDSSSSNSLTNNTISNNIYDFKNTSTGNTFSTNHFFHNAKNRMLAIVDSPRVNNVGVTVNSSLSMFDINGNACTNITVPSCSAVVTTSPAETVTSATVSNQVTASFTPTRPGTYSLIYKITDSNGNSNEKSETFLVGNTGSQTTRLYLRGTEPTHGQPAVNDSRSLLLTAPTGTETWNSSSWVQNSPDVEPIYPLANLVDINIHGYYQQLENNGAIVGVQRYLSHDGTTDFSSFIPVANSYTLLNRDFNNLNWGMDYPQSWYQMALKLRDSSPSWRTTVAQPSYADFTYQYATNPAIKSVSNDNLKVLSATADPIDNTKLSIVVENNSSNAGVTDVGLFGYNRAFLGTTSTISSSGDSSYAFSVNSGTTSTFNSIPLQISPTAGSVVVTINTWNTSGTYSKEWVETGDTPSATAVHVVGDLLPNTNYTVNVDGGSIFSQVYTTDGSGQLTFNYAAGYSAHTFDITPGGVISSPVISDTAPATNSFINSITSSSGVGYTLDRLVASGTITMTRTGGAADPSSPHTCTLIGNALHAGVHNNFDMSDTTNSCTVSQSLVSGAIYTFTYSVLDFAANPSNIVTNTNITFDNTAPTITGVSASNADGIYVTGQVIHIQVNFSENVYVTGTPQLALSTGSPAVTNVNYTSGSGSSTLIFDYTILDDNSSIDLEYVSTSSLSLNGGSIKDVANNNANLTLAAPGTPGSLSANKDIAINITIPTPPPAPIPTPTSPEETTESPAFQATENEATEEVTPEPTESPGEQQTDYTVRITVLDSDGEPIEGASVTISPENQEKTTDKNGIVEFDNVEPGSHMITATYQGETSQQSINLVSNDKEFNLSIKLTKTEESSEIAPAMSSIVYWVVGIIIVIIVLTSLLVLIVRKKNRNKASI